MHAQQPIAQSLDWIRDWPRWLIARGAARTRKQLAHALRYQRINQTRDRERSMHVLYSIGIAMEIIHPSVASYDRFLAGTSSDCDFDFFCAGVGFNAAPTMSHIHLQFSKLNITQFS